MKKKEYLTSGACMCLSLGAFGVVYAAGDPRSKEYSAG